MFCCMRFGGVCERKKKCTRTKKKKKRGYTAGGQVYCICFRARCSSFIHTYTYVCMFGCEYVCVCCQPPCPLPLPQPLPLLPSSGRPVFCVCILDCRLIVVVAVVSSGLLAILHLLFSISHLPPPPPSHTITSIQIYIHTYIPELTSNRQRLYFIISFACRRQPGRFACIVEWWTREGGGGSAYRKSKRNNNKMLIRSLSLARSLTLRRQRQRPPNQRQQQQAEEQQQQLK